MRSCPKCRKEYDDSWKMCLSCNVALENKEPSGLSAKELKELRSEISAVRSSLSELSIRLSRIERAAMSADQKAFASEEPLVPKHVKQVSASGQPGMKAFKYTWKIGSMEIVGEYYCKDEAALIRHVQDAGGNLVGILEVNDAPYDLRAKEDRPKADRLAETGIEQIPAQSVYRAEEEPRKFSGPNFEQMLGEKWFNKLGILAVVIGVALLIGYSFRYLGPAGKIGLGFIFGAGMIFFGHFMEKKEGFSLYGRGLVAGGWAIAYFTTFAMHHIPSVRLVSSPLAGMLLLMTISAATIADIYRYRSQVAIGFAYLLMFITLMITPLSFFTMAAAVPVALSLIFFMHKMEWTEFGLYGMAMTYFTYMAWFGIAKNAGRPPMTEQEFFVAAAFLVLYWAIFVVSAFLIKKDGKPTLHISALDLRAGFRDLFHALNTVTASLVGCVLLGLGFMQYTQGALVLAFGLYLALTALTYVTKERSLCVVSSGASIVFAAIYLAVKYSGYQLTVSYIILAQAILLAGILLKESFWRIFAFVGLVIIIGKLLIADSFMVSNTRLANHLSTRTLLFAFAFMVYLVNHLLYGRLRSAGRLSGIEKNYPDVISYGYPIIYAMGTWLDLPKVLTAPCWIILGVILLQFGISKNNYHQRFQGYILGIGAFLRLLMSNMLVAGGISIFSYRALTSVPVILLLYYCVMILNDRNNKDLLNGPEKRMIFIFPYMVFTALMVLVWYEAPKHLVAPVWGIISLVYSLRGVYSKERHYLSISSIAAIAAGARALFVNLLQGRYLVGSESNIIYLIITIGMLYLGNIFYLNSKEALGGIEGKGEGKVRAFLRSSRLVYSSVATTLLTALLMVRLQGVLLTVSLGLEGMLLFLAGFGIKEKHWRVFGLAILLITLAKAFLVDLRQLSTLHYILCLIGLGMALLFVSYVYTKNKDKIKKLI